MSGGSVGVLGTRAMLACAAARGIDVDALLRELHVPPTALADPDARIPLALDHRIWALAAARAGDPAFGLHVARQFGLGAFEALDYAMWSSANLADAIDRLVRFHRLIGDDAALRLQRRGSRAHLVRVHAHDLPQRAECFFAVLVVRARELVKGSIRPHEVRFAHVAPADTRPHRALFRCPVRFAAATSRLVIDDAALKLPVRTARPPLARVLDRYMQDLLDRLPEPSAFLGRAHHAIARALGGGPPSLAATAAALRTSRRTVQRRLQALGLTHRQLVDEVRRDLARRLLATASLSITEVAYLLGFEDGSGFYRAYRRWTGGAPSRHRPRLRP